MAADQGGGTGGSGGSGGKTGKRRSRPGDNPQVWWFRGKAYFSYAAYANAVYAYQQAQEAARRRAADIARQQARQQRQLQRQQAAIVRRASEQQALEAARRAARVRAAALREEANRRAEQLLLRQEAARRAREREALLLRQREEADRIALERQRELQRITQMRSATSARAAAYEELQRRERAIWLEYRRRQAVVNQQQVAADRLREDNVIQFDGTARGGLFEGVDPGARVRVPKPVEDRQRAIKKAQETGNWKEALDLLDSQSRQTGGRYVDPALYQAITEGLVSPVVTLGQAYDDKIAEINDALEADDLERAFEIWEDSEFTRLREEFIKWYGDPATGKKGKFERVAEILNGVADRQEAVWVRQLAGLPPQASDAQVAEVFRKGYEAAPKEMRGGFAEFADGRNPRMDLYYEMLEEKQKRSVADLRQEMQRRLKLSRDEGYVNVRFEGGNFFYDRPEYLQAIERVNELVPNSASRLAAIEQARANPALREQMIRSFMADVAAAFDESRQELSAYLEKTGLMAQSRVSSAISALGPSALGVRGFPTGDALAGSSEEAEYEGIKTRFLDTVAMAAFGRGWTQFDQVSTTGPGAVLQGAFTVFSTAPALIRAAFQQRSGNYSPYLDLHFWGEKGFGFEFGRVLDENADEARKMFEAALDSGDVGAIAEAVRQYSQWGEGNVGGLLTQMTDPLQFAGLGGLNKISRLAIARQGGMQALRRPRALLADFWSLARPRRLGGLGRDAIGIEWARLKAAHRLGIPYSEVKSASDDVWRELFERAVRGDEQLAMSDDLLRFLEKSKIDQTQLMSHVQRVVKEVADEFGLAPASSLRVHKLMRAAEQGFARARRELDAAKAKAKAIADEEAAIRTLQQVRRTAGVPLTERRITGAARTNYSRHLARAIGASQDYFKVADRARLLAESIDTIGRSPKPNFRLLHENFAELRTTLKEMRKFETRQAFRIPGTAPKRRGIVDKYWDDLRAHEQMAGWRYSAITADDVIKRGWSGIRQDRRWLKARERGLRQVIQSTKNPAQLKFLRGQLDEVMQARVGLEFEASLLDEGRNLARVASKRYADEIKKGVRPQQLGALATNNVQRSVETVRSLNAKLARVTKVESPKRLAKEVSEASDRVVARLEGENVAALLRSFGFDWGNDVSLLDAVLALQLSLADDALKVTYGPVWQQVKIRLWGVMQAEGWKRSYGGISTFIDDILAFQHVRAHSKVFNLDEFRVLDREVADALFDLRKRRAEGQIRRAGRGRARFTGEWRPSRFDLDPEWRITKIRALRKHGVSIHAYDDARSVLGDVLLRRRRMARLLWDARRVSRRTGEAVDDVFLRLRDQAALQESQREFVEWAMRPEMRGLTPEQVLRTFEEDYIGRDLGFAPDLVLNPYAHETLKTAFRAQAGFSPEDTHLLRRFFLGDTEALPPGARAPHPGEFAPIEGAENARVFVVPANHYQLTNPPAWARPRGKWEADLLREWDENLQKVTRSDRLDAPEGSVMDRVEDLDAALTQELSEQQASRRGADAGRRSSAASEVHRESRRNFAEEQVGEVAEGGATQTYNRFLGPSSLDVAGYRQWLWNEVRSSASFRRELRRLDFHRVPAGGGPKSDILAKAVRWLDSAEGKARFAPRKPHVLRRGLVGWSEEREWRNALLAEKSKLQAGLIEARKMAGIEGQVRVEKRWLREIALRLDDQLRSAGYYHATGDRNKAASLLEELKVLIGGSGENLDWLSQQKALRGRNTGVTGWISMRDARRFSAAVDDAAGSLDDLIEMGRIPFPRSAQSEILRGTDSDHWARVVDRMDARIKAIDDELRLGFSRDRARGNVGLSVTGDGIYIAEGHGDVTLGHEVFHQFWDDPQNGLWRRDIEHVVDNVVPPQVRTAIWNAIRINRSAYDPAEFTAELYALWRAGDNIGTDAIYSWNDLLRGLGADRVYLDQLGQAFDRWQPKIAAIAVPDVRIPPIHNRAKLRQWLVDNGYWSPRTGEAIASGERVWSIDEERAFFSSNWAFDPPWTDEVLLRPLLNDHEALRTAMRSWGFSDDGFEELVARDGLTPRQVQQQLSWGGDGIPRARTLDEMRRYARERYGALVWDGKRMVRMPWLMTADDEYLSWLGHALDEAGKAADRQRRESEWNAARERLPAPIRDAYFDGDILKRAGLDLDRNLVKAEQIPALTDAIKKATRRRLERMKKVGDIEPGVWLPQEQMRFAYDVVNELMLDRAWRGWLRGTPILGHGVQLWGQFWRMLVSLNIAFPVMNLLESFGYKRLYLTVYQNGFAPLGWDKDGKALVHSLREIGAESTSVFHLQHGPQTFTDWFSRVGDRSFNFNQRGGMLVEGLVRTPVLISKWGEDRLRLQFAQSVAGRAYRGARRAGMEDEAAKWLARAESNRMVRAFFATSPHRGWRMALDHLVPFFNYNWANKKLALRMTAEHPSVWIWGERISREIERQNREFWAHEHPDLPFPDGPSAGWVWFEVDGEVYQIDLSAFSDWTRALKAVSSDQTAIEWFTEFIRIPHPSQQAMLAALFGGMTPWGRPGHIRELNGWVDLLYWLNGQDYANPDWRRDLIQMGSQMMFFKKFGKISAERIKQMTYFAMRDLDPAAARAYLEANPDLQAYWAAKRAGGAKVEIPTGSEGVGRYDVLTDEEKALFSASMEEFDLLMNRLDADIARYANEPWGEEYRDAKRRAYEARLLFLSQHPEVVDFFAIHMSPSEFASHYARWKMDEEVEAFFSMERPSSDDYGNDLAYQKALIRFYEQREQFLQDHPSVKRALFEGRTAIERAWHDQELHWSEILEAQARIKVAILKEEARGASSDRDLVGSLYDLRADFGLALDATRYAVFDGIVHWDSADKMAQWRRAFNRQIRASGSAVALRAGRIPGFRRFLYERASEEERKQMDRDDRYFRAIGEIIEQATDGKTFYDLLRRRPGLLKEYWDRNPDARTRYLEGQEYFRWISSWVERLKRDDFVGAQSIWEQMPAWVHERYFAKHPDSGMRDGMGGSGSSEAVQYKGQWFKSPESRDRYIRFIEGGGSDADFPDGFVNPKDINFSSPEARRRFIRGQEYYAALGRWIDLLEKDRFEEADDYFRRLPQWMKEKYWAKHPEQRAEMELTSRLLREGAEYFLAKGADKLAILQKYPELRRWLDQHGGDEAAHRGLIVAMYSAIPSSEAWLKRTFREKFPEIFSQDAAGERRLDDVARDLAENPEVLPFFRKAVRLQYRLYQEQLKLSKVAPQPWVMERKRRFKKARKRRAARFHSRWSLYREIRRHTYVDQGRSSNRP